MGRRFFGVILGYCPTCEQNQFFSHMIGFSGTCPVCKTFVPNIFARTTEGATQIGAQRAAPSSPAKIQAEVKQVRRALDLAGEQRDDGQVEAAERPSE